MPKAAAVVTDAQKAARLAEKSANFKKLANTRIKKSLDAIAQLRALSNKGNYEYTDEQVTAMLKHLENGVVELAGYFKGTAKAHTTAEFV